MNIEHSQEDEYLIQHTPPLHFRATQQRPDVRFITSDRADAISSFFKLIAQRLELDPQFCGNLTLYSMGKGSIIASAHIDALPIREVVAA